MKVSILTITYRESDLIEAVIKNWNGKVDKHLILETKEPWQGPELAWDGTKKICDKYDHVEYITFNKFRDETEQRNWALGYLYDYDYVLIVDADELYTEKDQQLILDSIGVVKPFEDNQDCYRAGYIETYFKTPDYVWEPHDTHEPTIAVNPKKVLFTDCRIPNTQYQIPLDVKLHHLSYLRVDERIETKLKQFMHHDQVLDSWYEDVWKKWTPEMKNIRPYGPHQVSTVKRPMPHELTELL